MMNNFELQIGLHKLGFNPGLVDGIWGAKSKRAAALAVSQYRGRALPPLGNQQVAIAQIMMAVIGGLAVGVIDGIDGPKTQQAYKHWLQSRWRNMMDEWQLGDKRMPPSVKTTWPLESKMREYYGEPGANQVYVDTPYPLKLAWDLKVTTRRFQCHAKVKDSLSSIMAQVVQTYGLADIQKLGLDLWGGCFNVRVKRGGTNLSTHAWGIAVDWDPVRNALRTPWAQANFSKKEYDPWWDIWTEHGWLSLGKARGYDAMHVQAARLG